MSSGVYWLGDTSTNQIEGRAVRQVKRWARCSSGVLFCDSAFRDSSNQTPFGTVTVATANHPRQIRDAILEAIPGACAYINGLTSQA
jgi:hypothetical protein